MKGLEKVNLAANRFLVWVGGAFLVGMVVLTCANIFLRLVWLPLRGTFELMGFFGAIAAAFALGFTQIRRGHIAVDVLVDTFSAKNQRLVQAVNRLLCLVFALICAWQIAAKAAVLGASGEVTETLRIIYHPFTYAVAVGFAVLALAFLSDLVKTVFRSEDTPG